MAPFAQPATDGAVNTPVKGAGSIVTEAGVVSGRGRSPKGDVWGAHMQASAIKSNLSEDIWNSYVKICNVRNPWDKTVSYFHHHNRHIFEDDDAAIIKYFRLWLSKTYYLGQDIHIYTIDDAPVVDEFIRFETLKDDFERVCTRIGVPVVELPRKKARRRGKRKIPYQDYYDDNTKGIVEKFYKKDIEILGWSFDGK